ncbi:hypothetical protein Pst134EA_015474 [Puccinia striiformis f. sp. tritici]|uniref:hypothetical protein n=1 Tax=Puccinia striiformis f. sp. tritici TaxID=168172 RepID=UPI0020086BB4|nr:hypothetical protein Pst134EA_015474 [Puccinia striiformis f. sp. tritici]KAH9463387.1 hypothetical protein Pst134EA_015474 [Puccinia striiformis f. sp. tritici]
MPTSSPCDPQNSRTSFISLQPTSQIKSHHSSPSYHLPNKTVGLPIDQAFQITIGAIKSKCHQDHFSSKPIKGH